METQMTTDEQLQKIKNQVDDLATYFQSKNINSQEAIMLMTITIETLWHFIKETKKTEGKIIL